MATRCFSSIQGLALRVTRLDECGVPITGTSCDYAVSESFVTLNITAEIEEGEELTIAVGNGRICLNDSACATLKNYQIEMEVCNADTDFFNIISGVDKIYDYNNDVVGFEINQSFGTCERFALEIWTKAVGGEQCTTSISQILTENDDFIITEGDDFLIAEGDSSLNTQQYIYWLLPCVANGRIGDITIENGPLTWTLTGEALPSSKWGVGPYLVVPHNDDNAASPLLFPLESTIALHVQYTTIPPPSESCGCGTINGFGEYVDGYVDVY